ncbi:Glycerol-3-phosphate ABC transporter, permease protein UgpA [Pseudomonas orientalis]|nr:Glycerol-3-phosphate ABC transporter, permease protein UgpA [Pseudomonas orientalis]
MLANIVNDNAVFLVARGVFEFFASKLAPTREVTADRPV